MAEFQEFPKMARLSREVIVSEKIDGTNAAVVIQDMLLESGTPADCVAHVDRFLVFAQSRTRFITPANDNFGFAAWVREHAAELVAGLGEGRHFGEWFGSGIQRNYGLTEKRFALFNTIRWVPHDCHPQAIPSLDPRAEPKMQERAPTCCSVVPVLYRGPFDTTAVERCLENLRLVGSAVAPGFMKPEGVVVFHTAGNVGFKKTLDDDGIPKSLAKRQAAVAA